MDKSSTKKMCTDLSVMGLPPVCGIFRQEVEANRTHHLPGRLKELDRLNMDRFFGSILRHFLTIIPL